MSISLIIVSYLQHEIRTNISVSFLRLPLEQPDVALARLAGVTHSICTLEFENHRALYDWFLVPRQLLFSELVIRDVPGIYNYTMVSLYQI